MTRLRASGASARQALGLTRRQVECLRAIRTLTARLGHAPSYREIAAEIGMASYSGVVRLVRSLHDRGAIDWAPGKQRSIKLKENAMDAIAPARTFPLHPESKIPPGTDLQVPWELVALGADTALENHGKPLDRLAEAGGLTPSELVGAIEGRDLSYVWSLYDVDAFFTLQAYVRVWNAASQKSEVSNQRSD